MRAFNCFLVTLAASLLVGVGVTTASAINMSSTIWLDRYTILQDGITLQHDTGHLIGKGTFQVLTSEIEDPFWVSLVGIDTFVPISGCAIMDETMFDTYKAEGLIPKWNRSAGDFTIGYESFVIVTPKGFKPVTIKPLTTKQGLVPVKLGKSVRLRVSVKGTKPFTYQWYFTDVPFDADSDFNQWLQTFTPITGATNTVFKISKAQSDAVGWYYVVVRNALSWDQSDFLDLYMP